MYADFEDFINKNKNMFDAHIATKITLPTGGPHDCYIRFSKPNTNNGALEFIYINGYFTIQGDYGSSSFTWYNPNNSIEKLAEFARNFDYFSEKAKSAAHSEIPNKFFANWDSELCIKNVQTHLRENNIEQPKQKWEAATEGYLQWISFLQEYGFECFGDEWHDFFPSAGCTVSPHAYCMIYGFIKATEALNKNTQSDNK